MTVARNLTALIIGLGIAGSAMAMAPANDPAKKASMKAQSVQVKDKVSAFAYQAATNAANEAAQSMKESYTSIQKLPTQMVSRVQEIPNTVKNTVSGSADRAKGSLRNAKQNLKNMPKTAIGGTTGAFEDSYRSVKNSVGMGGVDFGNLNSNDPAVRAAEQKKMQDALKAQANQPLKDAKGAVTGTVGTVAGSPYDLYQSGSQSVKDATDVGGFGGTKSGIASSVGGLAGIPGNTITSTSKSIGNKVSAICEMPNQIGSNLKNQAKDVTRVSVREIASMPKYLVNKARGKSVANPMENISARLSSGSQSVSRSITDAPGEISSLGKGILADAKNAPGKASSDYDRYTGNLMDVPGQVMGQGQRSADKMTSLDDKLLDQAEGAKSRVLDAPGNLQSSGQNILNRQTSKVQGIGTNLMSQPDRIESAITRSLTQPADELLGMPGGVMNDITRSVTDIFDMKNMLGGSFSNVFKGAGADASAGMNDAFVTFQENIETRSERWMDDEISAAKKEARNIAKDAGKSAIKSARGGIKSLTDKKNKIRKAYFTKNTNPTNKERETVITKRQKALANVTAESMATAEQIRPKIVEGANKIKGMPISGSSVTADINAGTDIINNLTQQLILDIGMQVQILELEAMKGLNALDVVPLSVPQVPKGG